MWFGIATKYFFKFVGIRKKYKSGFQDRLESSTSDIRLLTSNKFYAMFIVHVFVHVKENQIEAFKKATIENAKNSINEAGIARFDFVEQQDDPTRFVLVEVYRTAEDPGKHKETAHYKKWRDTVADMMVEPRSAIKFYNVHPNEKGWG